MNFQSCVFFNSLLFGNQSSFESHVMGRPSFARAAPPEEERSTASNSAARSAGDTAAAVAAARARATALSRAA